MVKPDRLTMCILLSGDLLGEKSVCDIGAGGEEALMGDNTILALPLSFLVKATFNAGFENPRRLLVVIELLLALMESLPSFACGKRS